MKNPFILLALILLAIPSHGFAASGDVVALLEKIRLLRIELDLLLHSTTAVVFDQINSPIDKASVTTFSFKRIPADSSSPIDLSIETSSNKPIGTLSNQVLSNDVRWQVANNFVVGKSYLIVARDKYNNLLGRSGTFTVGPIIVPSVLPVQPAPVSKDASSADVNYGSIGFWSFDRYSNICNTKNGAVTNADGKIGSALGLNGTGAYCQVSNNRSFYLKYFTLALWAKSTPAFWNDSGWFISLRDQSGFNIGPVKGGKSVQFTILDDTNLIQVPYAVGTVTPENINDWHHYALTYDGSLASVYLDGVLATSTKVMISRNYAGNKDLNFGLDDTPSSQAFGSGMLDEIRIYNRPLTTCEIQILALRGCAGANTADVFSVFEATLLRLRDMLK